MDAKKIDSTDVICGAVLLGVFCFVGYVLRASHNMNRVADKLEVSLDAITKMTSDDIDISEAVINEAVLQAANEKARAVADKAASAAVKQVRETIVKEVRSAVDRAYSDMKDSVGKEMRKQAAEVDIEELKEEIIERAKDKAAEKFDSALDDILEGFNDNLQNVSKIYASITKAMSDKT